MNGCASEEGGNDSRVMLRKDLVFCDGFSIVV